MNSQLLSSLIESIAVPDIKTFYRNEGAIDEENGLHQRSITSVYQYLKHTEFKDKFLFKICAGGCIFKRFEIDGERYPNASRWDKKSHRETALNRMSKYPIIIDVEIPKYSEKEIVTRMVRGKTRQSKVINDPNEIVRMYIRLTRRKMEKLVRHSFRNGIKGN
jgi:hypothetical protein